MLKEIRAIKAQMQKAQDEIMRLAFMLEKWPDRAGELFGTAKLLIDWQEELYMSIEGIAKKAKIQVQIRTIIMGLERLGGMLGDDYPIETMRMPGFLQTMEGLHKKIGREERGRDNEDAHNEERTLR